MDYSYIQGYIAGRLKHYQDLLDNPNASATVPTTQVVEELNDIKELLEKPITR